MNIRDLTLLERLKKSHVWHRLSAAEKGAHKWQHDSLMAAWVIHTGRRGKHGYITSPELKWLYCVLTSGHTQEEYLAHLKMRGVQLYDFMAQNDPCTVYLWGGSRAVDRSIRCSDVWVLNLCETKSFLLKRIHKKWSVNNQLDRSYHWGHISLTFWFTHINACSLSLLQNVFGPTGGTIECIVGHVVARFWRGRRISEPGVEWHLDRWSTQLKMSHCALRIETNIL